MSPGKLYLEMFIKNAWETAAYTNFANLCELWRSQLKLVPVAVSALDLQSSARCMYIPEKEKVHSSHGPLPLVSALTLSPRTSVQWHGAPEGILVLPSGNIPRRRTARLDIRCVRGTIRRDDCNTSAYSHTFNSWG